MGNNLAGATVRSTGREGPANDADLENLSAYRFAGIRKRDARSSGVADPRARRPAVVATFVPSWAGERVRIRSGCHPQGPPTGPGDFLFEHLFAWIVDKDGNRVLHGLHGSVFRFVWSIG